MIFVIFNLSEAFKNDNVFRIFRNASGIIARLRAAGQATRALAAENNIQIECWYPLGHADPEMLGNDVLEAIAAAHDKSVVQIILRWHMQEGFSAVPGSTNPAHIQENIDIFDFELTEAEMDQIRALDTEKRYFNLPYDQMESFFPLADGA